jgi:hypothetical protein
VSSAAASVAVAAVAFASADAATCRVRSSAMRARAASTSAVRWATTCSNASPSDWPQTGQSSSGDSSAERAADASARASSCSAPRRAPPSAAAAAAGHLGRLPRPCRRRRVGLGGRGERRECLGGRQRRRERLERLDALGSRAELAQAGLGLGQRGLLVAQGAQAVGRVRDRRCGGLALEDERVVGAGEVVEGVEGLLRGGRRRGRGRQRRVGGGGPGVGLFVLGGGLGERGLEGGEVGEPVGEALVVGPCLPCVGAGRVARLVERGDAEEPQHEVAPLLRAVRAEGGDLLLLGVDRRPERGVVHAEHGVDVGADVAHAFRHLLVVPVGLGLDGVVGAGDRAPDQVEVALVLELDLGDAVALDVGGADLVLRGAGLAVEAEADGLDERALAGPVGPVDAHQAGGELELELVLVDAVVPQVEAGEQHQPVDSSTARAR